MELRPDNWFDAWWLAGRERCPTRFGADDQGAPTLLSLAADELKLVQSLLSRSWCEGPQDWTAAEWTELQSFEASVLDRLDEVRRGTGSPGGDPAVVLAFPPADHPMFAPEAVGYLLAEAWRLERHERFARWAVAETSRRDFVARARTNVHLRRIAVEAAMRAPDLRVYEALRRVYQEPRTREDVVAADLAFLARAHGGDAFRSGIADLGLHVRPDLPKFLPTRRRRRKPAALALAPRITVLIPSYRHEAFIATAIESCLAQSVADLRVLVADDLSPDRTAAKARAIDDPRLSVVVNEANLGLGASVLAALDRIDTPFVALLNSDDVFHPERLARCLEVFERDEAAALVATGFAVVDHTGAVLTSATSSPVAIGPNAHGWLRWHEGIVQQELQRKEDWVAFEVLLRHNVLATSSNMVFRTEWLRRHMPEASRLKYCVDWQLFLQAAMEGSLRMVEDRLLAYRLHDANTVWFREGGRTDYVLEVNRVVDRVLRRWFEQTVAAQGPEAAVNRLAQLLERDVRVHGETDGLILYLADMVRRHAGDAVDVAAEPLVALTEAALRRKVYGDVVQRLGVDPWSLPWRMRLAATWRIEHDVADGFAARARSLADVRQRLQHELDALRVDAETLRARQEATATARAAAEQRAAQLEAERGTLADQLATSSAELHEARQAHAAHTAALEQSLAQREAELAGLAQAVDALRLDLDARAASLRQASLEIGAAEARVAALRAEADGRELHIAELEAQAAGLRAELDAGQASAQRLRAEFDALAAAHDLLGARHERARAEARWLVRMRDRAIGAALAARDDLDARLRSPSWRLGDVLMRRVGVLGLYKTLASWGRRIGAAARHSIWHLRRVSTTAGRQRSCVVSFVEARDGAMLDERSLGGVALGAAGPLRLVGWTTHLVRAAVAEVPAAWLVDDAKLAAVDRARFWRRDAAGAEALDRRLAGAPWGDRGWRGARIAEAMGAGLTVASGLRSGAVQALAAKRLCGIRYSLALADEDLVDVRIPAALAAEILRDADLWVVDSEIVQRTAESLAGAPAKRCVVRWAIDPGPTAAPSPRAGQPLRAFVEWPAHLRADPATLVAAIAAAAARGCEILVDVVGGLGEGHAGLRRWFEFEEAVAAAGLEGRFRMHGDLAPAARRAVRDRADAVLWIGRSIGGAGLPRPVLEALAAGKVTIAAAVRELLWVPAVAEHVELVEPGSSASLAAAIERIAGDPVASARRAAAGRQLMVGRAQDEAGLALASMLDPGMGR